MVVHWGAPKNCVSYWQEIGRAGKDERLASAFYIHTLGLFYLGCVNTRSIDYEGTSKVSRLHQDTDGLYTTSTTLRIEDG